MKLQGMNFSKLAMTVFFLAATVGVSPAALAGILDEELTDAQMAVELGEVSGSAVRGSGKAKSARVIQNQKVKYAVDKQPQGSGSPAKAMKSEKDRRSVASKNEAEVVGK